MNTKQKRKILKLSGIAIFAVFSYFCLFDQPKMRASSSGPLPSHTGAPSEQTCFACHSSYDLNSGVGNLKITGLPKFYLPNQEIAVTVSLTDPKAKLYGFQSTAIDARGNQAGDFILPLVNPQPIQIIGGAVGGVPRSYVEHTAFGITPSQSASRSWTFIWRAPQRRIGRVRFFAAGNAAEGGGDTRNDYIYTKNSAVRSEASVADFDGDGKSDICVFRPSNGSWHYIGSENNIYQTAQFGAFGDKPLAADFDGDARADLAVFRPSESIWYVLESANQTFRAIRFGLGGDVPLSGDFSGDGRTDFAVFRPSDGIWYILDSDNLNFRAQNFGLSSDIPLTGDFDGDAKTDLTIYRGGIWFILKSGDNSVSIVNFGLSDDTPLTGDFDGDGRCDLAVFRQGIWYVLNSTNGFSAIQFGISTDTPTPGDYDGDGITDITVYRNGTWFIRQSGNGEILQKIFGLASDQPITAK